MNSNKEYAYIKEIVIEELKCIRLSAGGYEALLVPEVGANLVELKDINRNVNVLNNPYDAPWV